MFVLGTALNCWGTRQEEKRLLQINHVYKSYELQNPSRSSGCEEFEAENNNDFEGLVRKYCSRLLADKRQQGTLGICLFFIWTGFWPSDFPGVAVIPTRWASEQFQWMTRFVAIPGASEIFLLCLVVNKNLPSKHKQLFCLGFFFLCVAGGWNSRHEAGSDRFVENRPGAALWAESVRREVVRVGASEVNISWQLTTPVHPTLSPLECCDKWS